MKIGIFGGSFNPIHNGHLNAAEEVLHLTGVEEVWFVPCPKNPLKGNPQVSAEHRLKMIELAIEGNEKLKASDFQIKNNLIYTIDLLRALKAEFPQHEFVFIMGSNLVQEFSKWKQPEEIVKEFPIIVVPLPELNGIEEPLLKDAQVLREAKRNPSTSTVVREKLQKGESAEDMLPEKVLEYIKENNLYSK